MATIKEDYVSFEVAKLLKEKGFDEYCPESYFKMDKTLKKSGFSEWEMVNEIKAPTQSLAMKWLREVHKLSVRPRYEEVEDERERVYYFWFFDILSMSPYKTLVEIEQGYLTYEEACEAAIKYCLENLI
jgi:hypothetical protein